MPRRTSTLRWLLRSLAQSSKAASASLRRVLLPAAVSRSRSVGNHAEALAEAHLRKLSYTTRARSAITRKGEADLLMQAPTGELVIVEVKSRVRSSDASERSNAAPPELAITPDKVRRLRAIAQELARKNPRSRVRIDVIAIELDAQQQLLSLRHYINAA